MKVRNVIVLGVLSLSVLSCGSSEAETDEQNEVTEASNKRLERVSQEEFNKYLAEHKGEVNIIDVRTPGEYEGGFIPGAVNLDFYGKSFESEIDKLDKSKPTLIYCQGGGRSSEALDLMKDKGFEFVLELEGGYGSWTP